MSLDETAAYNFKDYGLRATKRFLKTAIVIDDEIMTEPLGPVAAGDVEPPPFLVIAGEQNASELSAVTDHDSSKNAEVQIKPLADAFLDKRIVCGVLKPETTDGDADVIERAVRAATVADVVIIDWYLRTNDDRLARRIVEQILQEDRDLNGRLRLIIVYTSADPLTSRRQELAKHLRESKFDVIEESDDDTLLTVGVCRVRFVRKKSLKTGMAVEDLPDFAIAEFAKHSNGLLANFALLGIAALRDATHHILANLDGRMDTAFVGHRMLLGHGNEAHEFAMTLLMLQIKSVLSLPKHLGSALDDNEVSAWLDERFGYANAGDQLKGIGTTKAKVRESVLNGTGKLDLSHKALFMPESQESPTNVGHVEAKLSLEFARFATFVRELDGFNPLPKDWVPTLTLGSVLKQVGKVNRYFLCVQPVCDTVRIKDERYFPFIELVMNKPSKSTENLSLRDVDKHVVVCVSTAPGSRHYDKFKADVTSETVRAEVESGKFVFSSKQDHYYWWLGDIDPLKAQRIATDTSGILARVGIDEYEWLRRGGSAKK